MKQDGGDFFTSSPQISDLLGKICSLESAQDKKSEHIFRYITASRFSVQVIMEENEKLWDEALASSIAQTAIYARYTRAVDAYKLGQLLGMYET